MESNFRSFEDLEAWKMAKEIRVATSVLVKNFPSEEKYRLTDQLIRCSRSIVANIAEGHGRYHYQENIQFCRQARGSLTEWLDHLICANEENLITTNELSTYRLQYNKTLKLLNGYIKYLTDQKTKSVTLKLDKSS